ncbi:non-ribosomal peptide synthetase [Myxococcus landrumensis]|uniref:Amino acid adenylation domain-containing protein n=1 Tax=Myxococcus landrumensis TaxID=2813577 RepID=A0ABX7NE90_9BACT|nr:non-ribosomal peptide synthetase [Myxococcus landrumus]QSQ17130.1 amino acid adenylation domain-containing protein [Myxococcus landrumus]
MSKFSDRILNAKARASLAALKKDAPAQKAIIPSTGRGNQVPLSSAQRRLWFLDRLEPGQAQYNVPIFVRLQGPLDERALRAALNQLLRRHESLRTCFTVQKDEPLQLIAEELTLELDIVDLGHLPDDEREQRIRELSTAESRKPFDLSLAPLVRATLLRAGPEDHVLLLAMHHIVSDGWSMSVFFFELGALYSAIRLGTEPTLPPLKLQYADFALWHNEWLRGDAFREQLEYWKKQLAGAPPLLTLPTDRPRLPVKRNQGAAVRISIPAEEVHALKKVSREERTTLFMTVLSLFKVLLGRYAGQTDISVGTPIANRNRPELEGLIGFFVNTLVLRTDLSGAPTFRQLIQRVREVSLGAYGNQDLPFEHVVEALHPERNLGQNPLFQVMFSLQESATASASLDGLALTPLSVETGTSKFDLLMALEETPAGITGELEYDTDLFDAATIERMLGHFRTLLTAAAAQPDTCISSLPLLTDVERNQLVVDWNNTSTDFPRQHCIHELFSAQAYASPNALAVRYGEESLTYAQLEAQANQLAWHLQSLGVVPDTLVGLYLERSPSLIVAMLACLKAGGAYLPLDTAYPAERLALMLRDSRAPLLLTTRALAGAIQPPEGVRVLCLEELAPTLVKLPTRAPSTRTTPSNLAYAIYTSGSTGQPKGIVVPHLGVVRLVRDSDYIHLSPQDRVAQVSNASFDAATFEIWGALLNGALLVGVPRDVSLSPPLFVQLLRQEAISTLFLTTALFNQLAHHAPNAFSTLATVLFGGELVAPDVVRSVLLHGPPSRLLHVYGPTENTTFSTWHLISSPPPPRHTVPIGRPLANSSALVLDGALQPVPVGVPGELYVGGEGLARGYLHQPSLTAERFVAHPFLPHARLYKTGDLVRLLPDGSIEFLGRSDFQVKIRGFRIELGEIEAALLRHPSLNDCVVLAREDSPGNRRLVAYFSSSTPPSSAELREFLKRSLPEYMLPSVFLCLTSLPLSPNGKVDRKALPSPDSSNVSDSYVAPRSPLEELLSNLWAQLLSLPRVGVDDNFFDLGGHSLLATQLVSRVRETLRIELPLRDLFSNPTVASLARVLSASLSGAQAPISPSPRDSRLPLSFAQQRLWLIDQLQPGSPAYNVPLAIHLSGELSLPSLQRALDALVERHESLRTSFALHGGHPFQLIAPSLSLPLTCVDLRQVPVDEREERLTQLSEEEARQPFDLSRGPLVRVALLRADDRKHILLLTMHHIVSDGWSMDVLFRELNALYTAFTRDESSPLAPMPIQYADFAVWQRQWLQGERLEAQLTYWKEQLSGAPPFLPLPTDFPRPAIQSLQGAVARRGLPLALLDSLKRLGKKEGTTLFMTLLAGFQVLLRRYSGQTDISVGTPIANRNRAELEGLIGFFVNSLVMRTDVSGAPSFRELLRRVREVALGAYAHQDVPFEQVVEALQPERDPSYSPLFQVMFALQSGAEQSPSASSLTMESKELRTHTSKFDLILATVETPEGLDCAVEYNTDLFTAATIDRLMGHFQTLLTAAAEQPDTRITSLPLITDVERKQLVVDWNNTSTDFPRQHCIHELFSAQARATPHALAVRYGEESLTYAQLEARANQLAWHLQSLGVVTDMLVGLYLERSPSLIVAMLACLKAGGAYLPLDTSYPPERLSFMLRDARAPILITTQALSGGLSSASDVHVLELDTHEEAFSKHPTYAPPASTQPSHLAYAIYTSGSTGQPKGIVVPHLGVVRLVRDSDYIQLSPQDRVAQVSNASFDAATFEIWGALLNGALLVGVPRDVSLSPPLFVQLLRQEAISTLFLTTALFNQLAHHAPNAFSTLATVLFGGELVDPDVVRSVLLHGPPSRLLHVYGPTENTTFSTWHLISSPPPPRHTVPIGRPLANSSALVLDGALQPVPVGVPGELYVGGDGLARGYLHQPSLTAERFVAHPFLPHARLYKTGDLVRLLPDGSIEFLGRSDFQVKIRGFRIELGEIEAALLRHPSLNDCVVLAREDSPGNRRLVAYFSSSTPPSSAELREFLKRSLPEYMLPSVFLCLTSLPLSPNGKVDRKALPSPDSSNVSDSYVAPRSPLEELLSNLWAQLLSLPRVGVDDNFFDLGGHSLLATQLVSRVRETLRIELPLRDLFSNPTVASLARVLSASLSGAQSPISPSPRDSRLPLSFAQQRLWLIDQLQPGSPAYNVPLAIHLSGELSLPSLQRALDALVERHESLRTSFALHGGHPFQLIAPSLSLPLALIDLSAEPGSDERARALALEEAQRPFNLARGPVIRATLLRTAPLRHVLLLTMHHIVSDGWSLEVLFRELSALYTAFTRDESSPLASMPIQYADFAVWQHQWLHGERLDAQLAYWKEHLTGAPSFLPLPTDFPRPASQSFRGAVEGITLPPALLESLVRLSRKEGTTLFMTLLAGFQLLLARYSGQDDISVGTAIANRNRAELEGLIGFFVNSLVMRTRLSGEPTFRELLRRVREVSLGAYAHQDVPFEQVVEALQVPRDPRYSPLYQVRFNLQDSPYGHLKMAGLDVSMLETEWNYTKFDLHLFMSATAEGLQTSFAYSTDLFKPETIRRMLGHLGQLLENVAANPDALITSVPLLTEAEQQQLKLWNTSTGTKAPSQCFHARFEQQAKATPQATALVSEDQSLTYQQLNERANQLAAHLQSLGVGPDRVVGLYLERSIELLVGLLAILKAGGAYLPMDPGLPQERLAFMMSDQRLPVVLTQESLRASIPPGEARVFCVDSQCEELAKLSHSNPPVTVEPHHLVYVIYTSGSTGQPKGVGITHGNLSHYLSGIERVLDVPAGLRYATVSTFAADLGNTMVFPALATGGALHIISDACATNPEAMAEYMNSRGIDCLKIVPSHLTALLTASRPEHVLPRQRLVLGGEASRWELMERVQSLAPDCRVINHYGPTETTIGVLTWAVPPRLATRPAPTVPLGFPIGATTTHVLDAHRQAVPVGVPGELFIGGPGVTRGYLGRPELTAERFVMLGEERVYKTGDVVRRLADGALEFLGRIDHQVKIRGFRIELGEIEAILCQQPEVRDAVVLAREDAVGTKRLVAYLVPHSGQALNTEPLRERLTQQMPEYMVPAVFMVLEALPLTANGKVDRKALPEPVSPSAASPTPEQAPQSPTEQLLASIWQEVLRVEHVSSTDNFFKLGGDSILSIMVVAKAIQAGLRLTPLDILECQNLADLAARVHSPDEPADEQTVSGSLPLTPIQNRFFELYPTNRHHWNQAFMFEVHKPLSLAQMEEAVRRLVRHHDSLRLRFVQGAAGWEQSYASLEVTVPFSHHDLSALPSSERVREQERQATSLQKSLNLSEGPLLRVAFFDWGQEQPGRLLLIIHHLATDGISWRVLMEDLQTLWEQLAAGKEPRLPSKTTSYQEWARKLSEYSQSDKARQELPVWTSEAYSRVAPIPRDFPEGRNIEGSTRLVEGALTQEETRVLLHRMRDVHGVNVDHVLLAALVRALTEWTGRKAHLLELDNHGRESILDGVELSRSVGWFTALSPVVVEEPAEATVGALLQAVKEQLQAVPNRGVGFGALRYLSRDTTVREQLARLPRTEVCFNYLGHFDLVRSGNAALRPASESVGPERGLDGPRSRVLDITAYVSEGTFHLVWAYSENLHERATLEKLSSAYLTHLRALLATAGST